MTRIFLLLLLVLFTGLAPDRASATAQQGDVLLLDGEEVELHTNPLAGWIAGHPGALPKSEYSITSNWRGYVATWEIAGDRLLLRKVEVMLRPDGAPAEGSDFRPVDVAPRMFPGVPEIVATWYSGALVVPRGELVNYVHMGYGSDYERYIVLVVRDGKVTSRRDLTNKQFRDFRKARFAAWKKTPQYAAAAADLRDSEHGDEWEEADIDDFFMGFYAEQYLSLEPKPRPKPVVKRKAKPQPEPTPDVEAEIKVEVE